jgi:hypothetical protein
MSSAELEPIRGLKALPQWGPGAEPLVGVGELRP